MRNFTKKFTKEHEWVSLENDIATVGITDHAQNELGEIVHVELPKTGDKFNSGDSLGTIESVKTVATIYSPLPGNVVEANQKLLKSPTLLNQHPLDQGWYAKLKVNQNEIKEKLNELMNEDQYKKYLQEASH